MRLFRVIYIVPVVIVSLLIFATYRDSVTVNRIDNTDIIKLPANLKSRLLTEYDSELLYIDYHDRKIQYYFISHNVDRAYAILGALRKIAVSLRYTLRDGSYLAFLHDGAHHISDWPVLATAASQAALDHKSAILIPDRYALDGYSAEFLEMEKHIHKYPWDMKRAKVFWRGSAFGVGPECNDIDGCDRFRFMHYAHNLDFADVGFTSYTTQLNPELLAQLSTMHPLKGYVKTNQSLAYKYQVDVDGNSCSYPRMAWILYSNCLLMKHASDKSQWYYPRLKPYVHYLAINDDFSNLEELYLWAETHPKEAQQIADNSRKLAKDIFRSDNVIKSLEQGFLQYHELMLATGSTDIN